MGGPLPISQRLGQNKKPRFLQAKENFPVDCQQTSPAMLFLSGSTSNGLKTQTETFALSRLQLLNHCAESGLASLHVHISQFLVIHLLFYIHTHPSGSVPLAEL